MRGMSITPRDTDGGGKIPACIINTHKMFSGIPNGLFYSLFVFVCKKPDVFPKY